MDFLQKPLAWCSKFYLSVQSKNCGRNVFFCFSFQKFFELWAKYFQTFGQKTSKICENYLLRVHRNNLRLWNFLNSFELFWIFCRNICHGSQNSIYVSRVKNAEKIVRFCFLFRIFFEIWAKTFRTFGQKNFKKF